MKYATRMNHIRASEIRELLKLTEQPDIISFAGGLPAPELFPVRELADILHGLASREGQSFLQYGTTAGHGPLRETISRRLRQTQGVRIDADQVLITNGSQQGLDFAGKLFLDKDSVLLCENPTYLAAINAFKAYEPRFVTVPTDRDGMLPDALAAVLERERDVRMIYVIPDFQNPTGISWSAERRTQFMDIIKETDIPVLEDNPYGELRFEGETPPTLMSLDKKGQVIGLGTFSKILCPGLRVGWLAGAPQFITRLELIKQGADLHTSHLTQACIQRYAECCDLEGHIGQIRTLYKSRRNVMLDEIRCRFPDEADIVPPAGGMFLWMTLPRHVNTRVLLERSLDRKVAFVPGGSFFHEGGHENTMRLNFSNTPEDRIPEGIRRLREAYDAM
jgi:2-aminoadipate transaminase